MTKIRSWWVQYPEVETLYMYIIDAILLHVVKLNRFVWDVCYFLSEALLILCWFCCGIQNFHLFGQALEVFPPRMVQWERKRSHLFEVSFNNLTSSNIPQTKRWKNPLEKTKKITPQKISSSYKKKMMKKKQKTHDIKGKKTHPIYPTQVQTDGEKPCKFPQVSQPFAAPEEGSCDICRRHHCGNGNWPGNVGHVEGCRNPTWRIIPVSK